MDLGLSGKTVVVTGGSGGIGRGLVLEFAREGANVASVDQDPGDHLTEAAREQGLKGTVTSFKADVTSRASVDAMVAALESRLGPIAVLVNNAGGGVKLAPIEELDDATQAWTAAVNMDGVLNCTLAVGKGMLARGKGSIVNISSNAALSGQAAAMNVYYGGAKGFVNSFAKGVAWEWGNRGVRVNTIAPGWIVPHSNDHVRGPGSWWNKLALKALGRPEDFQDRLDDGEIESRGTIPISRVGRPEDIAYLALFFASDVSGYITGQIVSVSGGAYMP